MLSLILPVLLTSPVICQYPDLGASQFVAPPGLPPAMAPHDHDYVKLPKDEHSEVLPNPELPYSSYHINPDVYLEKPETATPEPKSEQNLDSGNSSGEEGFPIDNSTTVTMQSEGSEIEKSDEKNGSGLPGESEQNSGLEEPTEGSGVESSAELGERSGSGVEGSAELEQGSGSGESSEVEGSAEIGEGSGSGEEPINGSGISDEDMNAIMSDMAHVAQKSGVACPADILFVIDSTSSVKGIFEEYKTYTAKVIQGLTVSATQDRVGVVLFSGPKTQREKIKLGQFNDPGKLISVVKSLPFLSGITATGAALNFTKSSLRNRRKNVETVVVVLTDGFSYDLTSEAAKQLRDLEKVKVYTVALGKPFVEKEMLDMAGNKERFLQGENSYGELVNHIKDCPQKLHTASHVETATVRHIETATDESGRHLIPNPVLTNKGYKHFDDRKDAEVHGSQAISQHITINEDRREDVAAPSCQNDIVIVFDASGSRKSNFNVQLELANEIVDKFVVGPKDTQFAGIKFAGKTKCRILFNFTNFSDKDSIKKRINETSFSSGITATNEALMKAVELFNGPGSRKDSAKPILILFTDGFSTESPIKGATYLHKMGITVFVVGVGQKPEEVYMEELKMIASDSSHVYLLSTFDKFLVDLEILGKNCVSH